MPCVVIRAPRRLRLWRGLQEATNYFITLERNQTVEGSKKSLSISQSLFVTILKTKYNKVKIVSKLGNGLPEKPTAHQADRRYNKIKHDNRKQKQTQPPTGQTDKVKVKRLTPTWTSHKFSSNSNE